MPSGADAPAGSDAHLAEKPLSSTRVFDGSFIKVNRDVVVLPDGERTTREYIVHPGATMTIPVLPNGDVVMVRQWRHPHARVFVEFPAGKIDAGEPPLETCRRELAEETGYTAERFAFLTTIHNAISYSDEHIDLYLAEGLTEGEPKLDDGEFLDVFTVAPSRILDWVRDGTITDVKTMIGAFWLEKVRAGDWRPD